MARPVEAVLLDAGGVLLDLDYAYLRRLIETRHRFATEDQLSRAESLARQQIDRTVRAGGRVGDAWRDYFHVILGHAGLGADEHPAVIDSLWDAHQRVGLWTVATPQGPSPYHLIATLTFDSMAAIGAAFASKEGQATAADVANFAQAGVQMAMFDTREV